MTEKIKARIMDEKKIERTLLRMATEIIERNRELEMVSLVGIQTRGVFLANRIQKILQKIEGIALEIGSLDITFFRDDLHLSEKQPAVKKTEIRFNIEGRHIVLFDDVLFTGRTVRAALDSLFDLGRPASVQLAVLIDRGHRELPIAADYKGKFLPTARNEKVKVLFKEIDQEDAVLICE